MSIQIRGGNELMIRHHRRRLGIRNKQQGRETEGPEPAPSFIYVYCMFVWMAS